jgi:hypothetical protein
MTKISGVLKVLLFSAVLLIAASSVSVFSVAILGRRQRSPQHESRD